MGQSVSRAMPCPGCGKTDWCFHLSEDAFICGRIHEPPDGYRKTGESKDGRGIFARIESKKQRINLGDVLPLRVDPTPQADIPQWENINPNAIDGCEYQIEYLYPDPVTREDFGKVVRKQWFDRRPAYDGKTKEIRPWHLATPTEGMKESGVKPWWVEGKGIDPWPLYRESEAKESIEYGGVNVLFYVAGEQAVETAREIGLTAITNQGGEGTAIAQVRDWLADLEYKPSLFVIWPDHDETGAAAAEKLRTACNFVVPTLVLEPLDIWAEMPTKGDITDYWKHLKDEQQAEEEPEFDYDLGDIARQEIEEAIRQAHHRLELSIGEPDFGDESLGGPPCKLAYRLDQCETVLGKRIRLNTLTNELELDGRPCDVSELRLIIAKRHNIETSLQDLEAIASAIGRANQYNPVMDYLDGVAATQADPQILEGLASRYFGSDDPIHQVMVKKFLIAAVARIYRPGVKVDNVLFLSGPQGYRKSTFFRYLAGSDWFDDSMGAMGDKDEVLKLHRVWFVEWAELETVFKRKEMAAVKAFLTCASDSLRRPYGRVVERMPRRSVIVGTTNETDILKDSTGNRRYWVIPVKKMIDTDLLTQERDQIWAAAVQAYRAGEIFKLTHEEEELANVSREDFTTDDVWDEAIFRHLEDHNGCTTTEILQDCIGIDLALQDRKQQHRVNEILKRFGYAQKVKRVEGKLKRIWLKSEDLPQNQGNNCNSNPEPLTPLTVEGVTVNVTVKNHENSGNPTAPTGKDFQGVTEVVTVNPTTVTPTSQKGENYCNNSEATTATLAQTDLQSNFEKSDQTSVTTSVTAETPTHQGLEPSCYSVTVKNTFLQTVSTEEGPEKIKPGDLVLIMASARVRVADFPRSDRPFGCRSNSWIGQDTLPLATFHKLREFFTVAAIQGKYAIVKPRDTSERGSLQILLTDLAKWEGPING